MKEKIAKWYAQGLWTEVMVRNAVAKGILSEEEAAQILEVCSMMKNPTEDISNTEEIDTAMSRNKLLSLSP